MSPDDDAHARVAPKRRFFNVETATPVVSFAQNAEDVRLLRVFDHVARGFYVDVGAADPVFGSVTKLFYDRGWSGINIEPGPYFPDLQRERPRDINLNMAVSAYDGTVEFHVAFPDTGLSTTQISAHRHIRTAISGFRQISVRSRPLREILTIEAPGRAVDFLKIDVEGDERTVIESADFAIHRPIVVVVEAVKSWSRIPSHEAWEPRLLGAGYEFAAFDGINRFYVRSENADLRDILAYPISPLDRFSPFADSRAAHEMVARRNEARAEALNDYRQGGRVESAASIGGQSGTEAVLKPIFVPPPLVRPTKARWLSRLPLGYSRRPPSPEEVKQSILSRYGEAIRAPQAWGIDPAPPAAAKAARKWTRLSLDRGRDRQAVTTPIDANLSAVADALDQPQDMLMPTWQAALAQALRACDRHAEPDLDRARYNTNVRAALLEAEFVTCLALRNPTRVAQGRPPQRNVTVVDARCLQDPNYRGRGIGLHAFDMLRALRDAVVAPDKLVLLLDPALPDVDTIVTALCDRVIYAPAAIELSRVSVFVCLSPMTAAIGPTVPFLLASEIRNVVVVYDFIPAEFPDFYLTSFDQRIAYRARLCALQCFDAFLPISEATADTIRQRFPAVDPAAILVTGVADPLNGVGKRTPLDTLPDPFVLAPTGGDVRKNLLAVIAAEGFRRADGLPPNAVVVVGHLTAEHRNAAVELAAGARMATGDVVFLEGISPAALATLYERAQACVVPSFAEGFSLPVLEAASRGAPVVASDIPAHRELVGSGWWLVPPRDIAAIAQAIDRAARERAAVSATQLSTLYRRSYANDIYQRVRVTCMRPIVDAATTKGAAGAELNDAARAARRRRIAIATPWPPHKSGVADYSFVTLTALAEIADVTILTLSELSAMPPGIQGREISAAAYLDPTYDHVISVLGNSHFHIPTLEYVTALGGPTIAHDNRMLELYWFLYDQPWVAQLLSRPGNSVTAADVPNYIADLNRLSDLGYRHVARVAEPFFVHSQALAKRINLETGSSPTVLPFIPQRAPVEPWSPTQWRAARARCSLDDGRHVAAFGFVDIRAKGADVLVEALAWLAQWGQPVKLHFVGGVVDGLRTALENQADHIGVGGSLVFHDFADPARYHDMLMAVDAAAQLRVSPLLTLSGAALDCITFGVPTVTTCAIKDELGAPSYVTAVPDKLSPLLIAEGLCHAVSQRDQNFDAIDLERRRYLSERPPARYAKLLLDRLQARDERRSGA